MAHANKYDTGELLRKFYEGRSSLAEEEALRGIGQGDCGQGPQDKAAAIMSELFRQEREVGCPGNIAVPLRRGRKLTILLRSVAAAAAAVLMALTVTTLSKPEPEVVYCMVNGKPVTDYDAAIVQGEIAIGIFSESLEMTAAMFGPLDEVNRLVLELEQTDIFEMLSPGSAVKNNNS